ncbi:MAG: Coenzyme F420 hydrogenase/dehydrogenase, beta subunit C-terminal domain [Euryarchaeota archaeon]|jgi:coenzyme F420 hydrogenase subunit beta|nr:Coenzyme F420 hydrogenase/dehydrogenase, beta subunit C-terminal domain [Euryarchaeota archaeon]HNS24486.1 Coenzyme F420 hydrogenase/dehydrogenase, beta subunit C-terminal domain [Methanobacteriaceae archaeon]
MSNQENVVAMVGTPCQIIAAENMSYFQDYLGESPVDIKVGLFCMENFSYHYLNQLLEERNIQLKDVSECRVEKGHMWFYLTDGQIQKIPLKEVKTCMRKNCEVCMDYTSELSDLSVGSVGSPDGWSTVIARTVKGLELLKKAEEDNYIETKPMTDSGIALIKKLACQKKEENKKKIKKRESVARPVIYRRFITDKQFREEVADCQFEDLKADVIDVGTCVLCGSCEYICPDDIIKIEDRKPRIKGQCPPDCNLCYVACPRTYLPVEVASPDLDQKPLGDYMKIVSAKASLVKGQDGGVVTALLSYALSDGIVDEALVVDKSSAEPWRPKVKLTSNIDDVLRASGTKYAACPVFKGLKSKNIKEEL